MFLAGLRRVSRQLGALSCQVSQSELSARSRRHLVRRGYATPDDFELLQEASGRAIISGYNDSGFVVGDVQYPGPILLYQGLVLRWGPGIGSVSDVSFESLAPALLLRPRPDLVLLGTGARVQRLNPIVRQLLVDEGILVECVDTRNSVATFNVLQQEGRNVLGAMLPVTAGG